MVGSGQEEQLIWSRMTVMFLAVITRYAYDSHKMHRESVRLRHEKATLSIGLERPLDARSMVQSLISNAIKNTDAGAVYAGVRDQRG
ncbi:hypothetical protein MCEMSEM18_02269 [Comamonadaceae bacterium]